LTLCSGGEIQLDSPHDIEEELMHTLRLFSAAAALTIVAVVFGYQINHGSGASILPAAPVLTSAAEITADKIPAEAIAANSYRLDASQSKFIAHAMAGGLFWFKGHDHLVAVREFTGAARLDPDAIASSSLQITAKAESMVETGSVFTDPQKQIINKELREIVLEPDKYPDIVFKSTNVTGQSSGANQYDLKVGGNLTLHGVTRPITIPVRVTVRGDELRAQGEFSIDRGDFKVKATSAFHGLVRVRDKVKFEFDIVGHRT
jgi:polyisoprenoid-binding protein YceI